MLAKRFFSLLTALALLGIPLLSAAAAEVSSDEVYCFSGADFVQEEGELKGICITALPESGLGTVMLGARVLQPGDILPADQLEALTFMPLRRETDAVATLSYLPIYADRVETEAQLTLCIFGKEDKAPVAEDFALETYKNLPIEGRLKVSDPEGQDLTFTLIRQPRRGQLELQEDGSFTYTPKKNKVGVDSFVFTATDPAGNVSREATVTVTVMKPTDATQYTDTQGLSCRFAAEWMKNTGIFTGEILAGNACFQPDREVTGGEFLAMLVRTLDIPTEDPAAFVFRSDCPQWLQPYLAAAVRAGLTVGLPSGGEFRTDAPITEGEAAVLLNNALDLAATDAGSTDAEEVPVWAADALEAMAGSGIPMNWGDTLTRGRAAEILYQISLLSDDSPGMAVLRAQAQ